MVKILLAVSDSKEMVLLDGQKSREYLRSHSLSTKFYCPQCSGEVRMKVGSVKIPHFAHLSTSSCQTFSEAESDVHIQGKQQLYNWLKTTHKNVYLEKSYPEFSQRADLSVTDEDHEYAIEFQRSQLTQEQWLLRTNGYKKYDIIPFWLLSTDCISKPVINQLTLSAFHQVFIRYSQTLQQFFLLTYDVDSHSFVVYEHLIPLSKNKFFYKKSMYHTSSLRFPRFPLNKLQLSTPTIEFYRSYYERWFEDRLRYGKGHRDPLLRYLYSEKQSIQLIPPWVGLPLKNSIYFKNSPIEWQVYLFLLLRKSENQGITLLQAECMIKQCLNQKKIELRRMSTTFDNEAVMVVVQEYFNLLKKLNVLTTKDNRYWLSKNNSSLFISHIAYKKDLVSQFWKIGKPIIIDHFNN